MGTAVRAAEKAVSCGEPMTCRGAALCRSPAFTTSGHFVPEKTPQRLYNLRGAMLFQYAI